MSSVSCSTIDRSTTRGEGANALWLSIQGRVMTGIVFAVQHLCLFGFVTMERVRHPPFFQRVSNLFHANTFHT